MTPSSTKNLCFFHPPVIFVLMNSPPEDILHVDWTIVLAPPTTWRATVCHLLVQLHTSNLLKTILKIILKIILKTIPKIILKTNPKTILETSPNPGSSLMPTHLSAISIQRKELYGSPFENAPKDPYFTKYWPSAQDQLQLWITQCC